MSNDKLQLPYNIPIIHFTTPYYWTKKMFPASLGLCRQTMVNTKKRDKERGSAEGGSDFARPKVETAKGAKERESVRPQEANLD